MDPAQLVQPGVVATAAGTLLTIMAIVFRSGKWMGGVEEEHEKQEEAHKMVHRDVEKILDNMDENIGSNRANCPTCSDEV